MAQNIANLSTEERAQFRQLAGTVNVGSFDFNIQQDLLFRATLASIVADDAVLMVAPNVISTTPLDSKVKAALFVLFDKAREAAKTLTAGAGDFGNVMIFAAGGVVVGIAIGWIVGD